MEFLFDGMRPDESMELIRDLWYRETALYGEAEDEELRLQHLEHCDALLDAYLEISEKIGTTIINNIYKK